MKYLLVLIALVTSVAFADEASLVTYQDSYLTLKHPSSFKVTTETDADGYVEIFVDGPNKTSVFITITSEVHDYNLQELLNNFDAEIVAQVAQKGDKVDRVFGKTQLTIAGEMRPGVTALYKGTKWFDKSRLQFTLYLVNSLTHSFLVQDERKNKAIESDKEIVNSILSSIVLK